MNLQSLVRFHLTLDLAIVLLLAFVPAVFGKTPGSVVVVPDDKDLQVTLSHSWDKAGQHASFTLGDGEKLLHNLQLLVEAPDGGTPGGSPDPSILSPAGLAPEETYMISWGSKDATAALEQTLSRIAEGFESTIPKDVGELAKLGLPYASAFDGVSLIAAGPVSGGEGQGAAILLFWNAGSPIAARSILGGAGPWWPFCCLIFDFICSGCQGSFLDCIDRGGNPCHAFDHCCLIARWLADIFHIG